MIPDRLMPALLGSAALLLPLAAMAQDGAGSYDLGTLVLYGDRTASTAAQSEASVAVLTEDRLGTPTSRSIEDAFRQIVNATDGDYTESGFVIRGINSEGLTPGGAGAPLASIYIDGVQQTAEGARRGMRGLFDAGQFELYRGPQSTLSGRNALAGAVYVRTKDPDIGQGTDHPGRGQPDRNGHRLWRRADRAAGLSDQRRMVEEGQRHQLPELSDLSPSRRPCERHLLLGAGQAVVAADRLGRHPRAVQLFPFLRVAGPQPDRRAGLEPGQRHHLR